MPSNFNPLVPTGLVNLDVDYQNLQANNAQLDVTFGIDHTTFSNATAQNGYHKVIHQIPFSTTASNPPNNQPVVAPAAVSGFGQLFQAQIDNGLGADEALFFLSGGNKLTQLTGNLAPLAATNGYTSLPGGFIIQWGFKAQTSQGTGTVLFTTSNINFPNNCFNVTATAVYNSNSANPSGSSVMQIDTHTLSKLKFEYKMFTNSSAYTGFYWFAIGN